jgi:hypothetical protein
MTSATDQFPFNNFLARKGIFALVAVLTLASCTAGNGQGLDASGNPLGSAGGVVSSDFQEIQDTIFTPICTQCHIGATAPRGLRLDAANSYAMIVNVPSSEVPSLMRIKPGDPDSSYLVQKCQGNAAVGARMPFGGPYLPQDRIDLVRRWIAAGALPASVAPPNKLTVSSTVPGSAEVAQAGLDRLVVIFSRDVDATLASSGTFSVVDGNDQPVTIASSRVPPGRSNVVELAFAAPLAAGSYQLTVHGEGAVALADNAGHVLDGDADGQPGGDFLMSFDVSPGASR